jgi:hypothetical protein
MFARVLPAVALVALLGAGCATETKTSASVDADTSSESAGATLDIDAMINDAQREADEDMQREKQENDAEIYAESKTAIESPESEGVSFED